MATVSGGGGEEGDDGVNSAVAALNIKGKFQKKKPDCSSHGKSSNSTNNCGVGGGSSGGDGGLSYFVCDRHWKYGEKAYRCDLPNCCQWQGN